MGIDLVFSLFVALDEVVFGGLMRGVGAYRG